MSEINVLGRKAIFFHPSGSFEFGTIEFLAFVCNFTIDSKYQKSGRWILEDNKIKIIINYGEIQIIASIKDNIIHGKITENLIERDFYAILFYKKDNGELKSRIFLCIERLNTITESYGNTSLNLIEKWICQFTKTNQEIVLSEVCKYLESYNRCMPNKMNFINKMLFNFNQDKDYLVLREIIGSTDFLFLNPIQFIDKIKDIDSSFAQILIKNEEKSLANQKELQKKKTEIEEIRKEKKAIKEAIVKEAPYSIKIIPFLIDEEYLTNSKWEIFRDKAEFLTDKKIKFDKDGKICTIDEEGYFEDSLGNWKIKKKTIYFEFYSIDIQFDCQINNSEMIGYGKLDGATEYTWIFHAKCAGQSTLLVNNSNVSMDENDPKCFKWKITSDSKGLFNGCTIDTIFDDDCEINNTLKKWSDWGEWEVNDNKIKLSVSLDLKSFNGEVSKNSSFITFRNNIWKNWTFSARLIELKEKDSYKQEEIEPEEDDELITSDSCLENFSDKEFAFKRISTGYGSTIKGLFREPFHIFIDTETNGLPDSYPDPKIYPGVYPEILQIALLCCDADGKRILGANKYINPYGWKIKEEVIQFLNLDKEKLEKMRVNGIYINEIPEHSIELLFSLKDFGKSISENIYDIFGILRSQYKVEYIIGHNLDYDLNCLIALYERSRNKPDYQEFSKTFYENFISVLPRLNKICTMKSTTEFCGITNQYGYKYPKLSELHFKLFDRELKDAHDAWADVNNTAKCYWRLRDLEEID